ncbi:MAG: peptidase M23, partial [Pedobacter sp.]
MKLQKILLLLFLACFTIGANAQSSADLKRKKDAINRELEQLQKNLNAAEKSKKLTLAQVNTLKTQIRLRQQKIEVVNSEIKN